MNKIKKFFDGKKTKLAAAGLAALSAAVLFGLIDLTPEQLDAAMGLLGSAAALGLRLAIAKISPEETP